ncbi:hypothetical protein GOP47_0002243 [Adiantum capillus-veneris]|uniref:Uncharacterized protein n=1 Tax=Adiantum capillus-veneris TaxID=13818 RepID=A0A9D4V9S9_ADICA|nr:hypothetical protein GOP47_0002243 [Adiantum capillus-veneris]
MDREVAADFYVQQREKRVAKFNQRLPKKELQEGDLVMKYESYLDFTFQKKFTRKWIGPYKIAKAFPNSTYQLERSNGKLLRNRVNGSSSSQALFRALFRQSSHARCSSGSC